MAQLFSPDVLVYIEDSPTATLPCAVLFDRKALLPIATLCEPDEFVNNALDPTAQLLIPKVLLKEEL